MGRTVGGWGRKGKNKLRCYMVIMMMKPDSIFILSKNVKKSEYATAAGLKPRKSPKGYAGLVTILHNCNALLHNSARNTTCKTTSSVLWSEVVSVSMAFNRHHEKIIMAATIKMQPSTTKFSHLRDTTFAYHSAALSNGLVILQWV